jgi:SsrA-binding protein
MSKKPEDAENGEKILAKNRRATFDYHLEERYEAGMVLVGSEVKSMRAGTVDITDAWASIERDGLYLKNLTVQPLPHAAYPHEPRRPRKLLLHQREIEAIQKAIDHDKKTLIPLRIYLKNGRVKTEIALATGKKKGDKREAIRSREEKREAESAIRRGRRE